MSVYMLLDLYLRLSDLRVEDLDEHGASRGLTFAEKKLRERAEQMGVRIGEVIVENDIVDGKPKPASAWKRKTIVDKNGEKVRRVLRPGFQRILARIKTKQSGGLMTVDLDRAMRDPRDLEDLVDACEETGANVRSLTGSLTLTDGGTSHEQLSARIAVAMAKKSSDDTARRVAASRERRAEAGEFGGGKRPFGFEANGITVVESEAREIVKATRAILSGVSLRSVTADLRQRNVPTVKGGVWTTSSVKDILSRPRNAGIKVYKGKELTDKPAPWNAIVTVDEYRAVVNKLRVRQAPPGRSPKWLGTGIYRCNCGGPLEAHVQPERKPRYRCKDTGRMTGAHVARDLLELDRFVTDLVIDWCAQPVAMQRLLHEKRAEIDLDALRAEVKARQERLIEKAELNFDHPEEYSDAQLRVFTRKTNERLRQIDQLFEEAREESPVMDLVRAGMDEEAIAKRRDLILLEWNRLSLGHQRSVLRALMKVTVRPAPERGPKKFNPRLIEIQWLY